MTFSTLYSKYQGLSRQFFLFTLVGVAATTTQYIVLVSLVELFTLQAVYASCYGYLAGAGISYTLNRKHTFKSTKAHHKAMVQFLSIFCISFGFNAVVMTVTTQWLHLQYLLGQVISTGLVFLWNFGAHRRWTYRDPVG